MRKQFDEVIEEFMTIVSDPNHELIVGLKKLRDLTDDNLDEESTKIIIDNALKSWHNRIRESIDEFEASAKHEDTPAAAGYSEHPAYDDGAVSGDDGDPGARLDDIIGLSDFLRYLDGERGSAPGSKVPDFHTVESDISALMGAKEQTEEPTESHSEGEGDSGDIPLKILSSAIKGAFYAFGIKNETVDKLCALLTLVDGSRVELSEVITQCMEIIFEIGSPLREQLSAENLAELAALFNGGEESESSGETDGAEESDAE